MCPGCVFSRSGLVAPRGDHYKQKYVAFLSISAISSVTNTKPLMRGGAAFVYHALSVDTIRESVDGTLLPAVMDQILVDSRDFYTPSGCVVAIHRQGQRCCTVFHLPTPGMVSLCLADALVLNFTFIW